MKLILSIYGHGEVMQLKSCQGESIIKELLPFDCHHFNDFFLSSAIPL